MKTINKITKGIKIINYSLAVGGLYCLTLAGTQGISQETSPKINNPIRLEQILETEKRRAEIKENIIINATIRENEEVSYARKIGEKEYEIVLSQMNAKESTLKHELYHIADGHCDKKYNVLKYLFWDEPKATIYQVTGWKLK